MAWTDPSALNYTANTLDATELNAHWRDNLRYLHDPPSCRVKRTTNQLFTTGLAANITFDAEEWDTDTMHSTSTNTDRVTFTTAGRYVLTGCLSWAANATGYRNAAISHNIDAEIAHFLMPEVTVLPGVVLPVIAIHSCAAAEYVVLWAVQTSGGNLNVLAEGGWSPHLSAHWVGG